VAEKIFKHIEFYFEYNGHRYGGLYNLIYDAAEVLAVEINDVWDFDSGHSVVIKPVNDSNILLLAAADKAAYRHAIAKHNWLIALDWD